MVRKGPFYDVGDVSNLIETSDNNNNMDTELEQLFNEHYASSIEESQRNSALNSFKLSSLQDRTFPFFYLGDLVDIILKEIPKNLNSVSDISENYLNLEISEEFKNEEEEILQKSIHLFNLDLF